MKFVTFAGLVASALVSTAAAANHSGKPTDFVGKAAPKFSVKTLEGESLTNAKLKGKVVVLDFWATWCTSCIKAGPTMQKIYDDNGGNVVVIGMDAKETKSRPAASTDYRKKHGYTYKFVSNADAAHKAFKGIGLPLIVVIGKNGVVRAVFDDFDPTKTGEQIEAAVKAAL